VSRYPQYIRKERSDLQRNCSFVRKISAPINSSKPRSMRIQRRMPCGPRGCPVQAKLNMLTNVSKTLQCNSADLFCGAVHVNRRSDEHGKANTGSFASLRWRLHTVGRGHPNFWWHRATPFIGWFVGRTWEKNSKWYSWMHKLLCSFYGKNVAAGREWETHGVGQADSSSASQEILLHFYRTVKSNSAITIVRHLSLSWARLIPLNALQFYLQDQS
jgi:hypothetical protein